MLTILWRDLALSYKLIRESRELEGRIRYSLDADWLILMIVHSRRGRSHNLTVILESTAATLISITATKKLANHCLDVGRAHHLT